MGKSEAQIRNEEAVRKIMAERGYDRTPVKKKKYKKIPKKYFVLLGVVVLLAAIVAVAVVIIRDEDNDAESGGQDDNYYSAEIDEEGKNKEEQTSEEVNDETGVVKSSDDDYIPAEEYVPENRNVDYLYTDDDGTRHYSDGSTFNPHYCDALEEKYENAKSEAESLRAIWEDAFKNQLSFSELYEKAGKNMALAKQWLAEQQQAIDDAMKTYQEALDKANAIYNDEIIPCRKKMYEGNYEN